MTRRLATPLLAVMLACASPPAAPETPSGPSVDWPHVLGDPAGSRWSPLQDITLDNVNALEPSWSWRTGEIPRTDPGTRRRLRAGGFQASPVMINDTLWLSTGFSQAVALDAESGRELWRFDPDVTRWGAIQNDHAQFVHRGVALWQGPNGRRVFLTARWKLWALDAATGQPDTTFGTHGWVDLGADLRWPANRLHIGNTSPPAIWGDVVIVGSAIGDNLIYERDPPGDVQAFDARSGERLWRWDPVPPPDDPARASWGAGSAERSGHANVWSFMTVDTARGLVFLPVSTPSNDWYGGDRPGDNRWAESVVCLDARTGRLVWARQLVHHGLWDYDPAAPPVLATATIAGQSRDLVVQAGKTGFLYVFDRVTGIPIWPIEEREVPGSDVPGEVASRTQPFPTWPAPFAAQGIGLEDANDLDAELQDSARAILSRYRLGPIFTPPSLTGTVVRPGWIGGAGWGATSLDPERGILYIKSTSLPVLAKLVVDSAPGVPYRIAAMPDGMDAPLWLRIPQATRFGRPTGRGARIPVTKPPYGELTAVDLGTGAHLWRVTVGDLPVVRRHQRFRDLGLAPLGVPGPQGGVTTASGLIFLAGGGAVLYALDVATGSERWSHDLARPALGNPITYRTRRGYQYVVVATGSGADATLRAFRLATGEHRP